MSSNKRLRTDDVDNTTDQIAKVTISPSNDKSGKGPSQKPFNKGNRHGGKKGQQSKDSSFEQHRNKKNATNNTKLDQSFDEMRNSLSNYTFTRPLLVEPREFQLETRKLTLFMNGLVEFIMSRYRSIARNVDTPLIDLQRSLRIIMHDLLLIRIRNARKAYADGTGSRFEAYYTPMHSNIRANLEAAVYIPLPLMDLFNMVGKFEQTSRKQVYVPYPYQCLTDREAYLCAPAWQAYTFAPSFDGEAWEYQFDVNDLPVAQAALGFYQQYGEAEIIPPNTLRVTFEDRGIAILRWNRFIANAKRSGFPYGFDTIRYRDIGDEGSSAQLTARHGNQYYTKADDVTMESIQLGGYVFAPSVVILPSHANWNERLFTVQAYTDQVIENQLHDRMDMRTEPNP